MGDLHFCAPYAVTAGECARQLRAFEETKDFTEITHGIRLSPEEEKRRFAIRHVLIRKGFCSGELMVCLVINCKKAAGLRGVLAAVWQPGLGGFPCDRPVDGGGAGVSG